MLVLHLFTSLEFNHQRIAPVLNSFKENYWRSMRETSSYLQERCSSSDVVLVERDIGMLAFYGNNSYGIVDGGALASPELLGLSIEEKISLTRPKYLVETLGKNPSELARKDKRLKLVLSKKFASHSVGFPELNFHCNVFEVD